MRAQSCYLWLALLALPCISCASDAPASEGGVLGPPQGRGPESNAAVAVHDALALLHTLEPSRHQPARREKPPGVLGKTAHYAWELFALLFMNPPPQDTGSHAVKLTPPLSDAVRLLKSAARENNPDALYLLADMHFYGNFSHPRNYSEAFRLYHHLASLTGNGTAQHMVGFMYGTGFGGAVTRDQGKALLFHTFAALGGETRSEMTVAFRHYTGVGAPRNCDEAAFYYKKVADKAIHHWRSGPPGGRSLIRNAYRLADDEGGVYGEGASVSSSGPNAVQGGSSADAHAALDDVLEYLDLMSRKGDLKATFSLGRLHYDGSRAMRRNLRKAKAYFMIIARKQWPQDGRVPTANIPGLDKLAARAAGYLGRMFLRGEGMEQSFEKAETWFRRGLEFGDFTSQNGMGLLYLHGYGVPRDVAKAAEFFKESATQDYAPAQVHLGALFLDQGDVQVAIRYFELAARNGHVEAFYYLAEILNQGIGRERSCVTATAYFKIVAETVEYLHSDFETANQAYHNGDTETALIQYTMAAEQGFEAGQANVAYLLDDEKSRLPINPLPSSKKRKSSLLRDQALALVYWTRSAKQSNIDSLVKMGDYYLKGVGADADSEKAATCYQAAAETPQSAQALWNLGWMHENGIGVEQDYHLAKRLYDQALETNQEAYLPVSLSLLKLRLRSFWNTITNGRVNSIQPDPEPQRDWSFREWIHNFLQDDHPPYDDMYEDDDGMDTQQDGLAGTADIFDDFVDDGIVESLLIVALAAVLAFLVYYRQQRQLNHRRAEQQHAPIEGGFTGPAPVAEAQGAVQEQDRGLFPRPEDPEFGQWVAGGVMH